MSASPAQPPEQDAATATGGTGAPRLLVDQFLPRHDLAVAHARIFRARPEVCFRAANEVDLFRSPLVRALLDLRELPQRLAETLRGQPRATTSGASRASFRFTDLVGLGWTVLGETPGSELVLGQVGRPWRAVALPTGSAMALERFVSFDHPGFTKIATSLRIDPYGDRSSILAMETRVLVTDDASRRRFHRYWLLIGPFSDLIRRTAMRQLASDLSEPVSRGPGEGPGQS